MYKCVLYNKLNIFGRRRLAKARQILQPRSLVGGLVILQT